MLSKYTIKRQTMWSVFLTSLTLLLALFASFGPLAGTAQAGQDKVAVCHLNGDGNYVPINIADPALPAHLEHGDLVVGVDVDENCQPLESDGDSDGVPDAEDNCANVANPGQEDRYGTAAGDACEDLDGDGTPDVNEANFCLSIDGVLLESQGTAVCGSSPTTGQEPNVAVANGDGATAYAAVHANGTSLPGDNNTAIAIGDNAVAIAGEGDNNSATASGNSARALAAKGNNNTAIAEGDDAYAEAFNGDNNSATATGTDAAARIFNGNNNSATATGTSAFAGADEGDNNTVTAEGDDAYAEVFSGDNNSATSTGVYTCAGAGDNGETAVNENLCN
ncbi:MAG: thrombospondin type 3 repeat-containing protein [Anaerolineae bacterium]|nr:thrombospondin type 3 repeat-containing protein [Anaerolineae bacterium]